MSPYSFRRLNGYQLTFGEFVPKCDGILAAQGVRDRRYCVTWGRLGNLQCVVRPDYFEKATEFHRILRDDVHFSTGTILRDYCVPLGSQKLTEFCMTGD